MSDCRVTFLLKDKPLKLWVDQLKNLCDYNGIMDCNIIVSKKLDSEPKVEKDEDSISSGFYDQKSFEDAWSIINPKLQEARSEYYHLVELKKSIDYYKLTDEQQTNLLEDIEYKLESVEELDSKLSACFYMIALLDQLSYEEDNNVLAYIEFV